MLSVLTTIVTDGTAKANWPPKQKSSKQLNKAMRPTKITVETTIPKATNKVWDFWTKPEHITKWNFATEDWQCPKVKNDLRAGGKYFARMEAKDGSFGFDFEAVYNEVIDQKKLTYTMSDGRQATTVFENLDGSTKVTTAFDPENVNDPEMQRAGWQAIMDNFKKYAEGTQNTAASETLNPL
jgi:uncharacterized protein YndB with AHSA1/START domain